MPEPALESLPATHDPHLASAADVVHALSSDSEQGLPAGEAQHRLEVYGANELQAEVPVPAWRRFAAQFRDTLVLLLLVATAISFGIWLYERDTPLPYEALAILSVVTFNALMGYLQEARAESAIAALQQLTAAQAQVLRSGERRQIAASLVVPGDILFVEEGDTVAADARVLDSSALQAAEAALTGESLPTSKQVETLAEAGSLGDRTNMLWSGTAITYGRGRAIVTATGQHTEMGRIAGLLRSVPSETTPLQKQLELVGKRLGQSVIAIAIVVIATILFVQRVETFAALLDVLILGVALAVAAVPESLPAVVTAVLSLGVQRMARRNAIVRHLSAVETLGSASVICSDKTGTLTKNEMTVRVVATRTGEVHISGTGYAPQGEAQHADGGPISAPHHAELEIALVIAERANNAVVQEEAGRWVVHGDPTEGALIVAAQKYGLERSALSARWPRVAEIPFSSERKRMSSIHRDAQNGAGAVLFSKGAPDVLLEQCTHELTGDADERLTPARRSAIMQHNDALALRGLRTLGVARRAVAADASAADEHDLVFVGLIGMIDPPREEARAAIARARGAGIRTLMITGDHPATARAIAADLGMAEDPRVVSGRELSHMPESELDRAVQTVDVFARVDPEHKLRIVRSLARDGAVVAMTGDGVNDAPALKTADIGIAMGITGTDVAKRAADMILADDNFATILAAVEEGRTIFANIRNTLRYLLSSNIGEVLTMFLGVVLAQPLGLVGHGHELMLPLLATQLLWINLLTDSAPALALGVDRADAGVMERPPRPTGEGVITRAMWTSMLLVGASMAIITLLVLDASLPGGLIAGTGTPEYARTRAFTTLVLCQLFNVLNSRSQTRSAFHQLFTNTWLWVALATSLLLQVAVIYLPPLQHAFSTVVLSAPDWGVCAALASAVLWLSELGKLASRVGRAELFG